MAAQLRGTLTLPPAMPRFNWSPGWRRCCNNYPRAPWRPPAAGSGADWRRWWMLRMVGFSMWDADYCFWAIYCFLNFKNTPSMSRAIQLFSSMVVNCQIYPEHPVLFIWMRSRSSSRIRLKIYWWYRWLLQTWYIGSAIRCTPWQCKWWNQREGPWSLTWSS